MAKIFFFAQEHKRRMFTNRESLTILRFCSSLISHPGGFTAAAVMKALYAEEEGEELVRRIRILHPDPYRKRLTDRVQTEKRKMKLNKLGLIW